jgi:hypothetical protein
MSRQAAIVRARAIVRRIAGKGLSIYDRIAIGDPRLWLPAPELEAILKEALPGLNVDYAPRTRSKVVKAAVCEALGYPVPATFARTQPRFPGQDFDTYVQKSTNLQVWNEELSPTRRYVLIKVDARDIIETVKVVTGDRLAELDTTGTLTQKYQARYNPRAADVELLSSVDTPSVARIVGTKTLSLDARARSIDYPQPGSLRSIADLFSALSRLRGHVFPDRGTTQDRNRGGDLHRVVCEVLGYADFEDDGSCPDIKHQLLEIKLQTAATIDLGLVRPNSTAPLDIPMVAETQITHSDLRYAIVGGVIDRKIVRVTNLYVVTGADFFNFFPQFGGKVLNKKLQIPLPRRFFEA